MIRIGLVIMASGKSVRFGREKLMEPLDDKPLIGWILQTTQDLFETRVVVTRSIKVKDFASDLGIDCILHDMPHRNDTVRLGLGALKDEIDYCFFVPGDQPLITRDTFEKLRDEAKKTSEKMIRTQFGEAVGSPIGFPKSLFEELLRLPEGKGGNYLTAKYASMVHIVPVKEEYELWDVDTTEDLDKIKNILQNMK